MSRLMCALVAIIATLLAGCGSGSDAVPTIGHLSATNIDGTALPTRIVFGETAYTGHVDEWIRFALQPTRGGLNPGEAMVTVSVWLTHTHVDIDRHPDDPNTTVKVHEPGSYRVDWLVGLADGSNRVEGSCRLDIGSPALTVESSRDGMTWTNVPVIDDDFASVPAGWWHRVRSEWGTTTRAQLDGGDIPDGGEVYVPNTAMRLRGDYTYSFWCVGGGGQNLFLDVVVNAD